MTPSKVKPDFPGDVTGQEHCKSEEAGGPEGDCLKIWYTSTGEKLDCKKDKPKANDDLKVRCASKSDPDVMERYDDLPNTYF